MPGIRVEKVGEKIHLIGWVGPETPDLCKSVGAGRFVPKDKGGPHWVYPLEVGTCYRLREVFGKRLVIGDDLNVWARAAIAAQKSLADLAGSDTAALSVLPTMAPVIESATMSRTYQRVAAAWGASVGSFVLADQQGLGKTIETLAGLIERTPDPFDVKYHLVFAPKIAVTCVWDPEIGQWMGDLAERYVLSGERAQREETLNSVPRDGLTANPAARHVFVIANIEMARIKPHMNEKGKKAYDVKDAEYPELFARVWDTIIVDESHRALIRTKGEPTQQRAGFNKLRSRDRIAISGTPMRGKPAQYWGTLNWIRPDIFTSFWKWVALYFEIVSDGYSEYIIGGLKPDGAERMARDLAPYVLRRTKEEVLSELPPKQYAGQYLIESDAADVAYAVAHGEPMPTYLSPHGVWLEMSPRHRKQYEKFIEDGSIDFEDGSFMTASGELAEYTRRKQLSSAVHKMVNGKLTPTTDSPKFEWLVQKIDELGITEGSGAKIVVASQFTGLLKVFTEGLREKGIAVHLLTGESSEKSRVAMVKDFQSENSTANVFLLNTKAGGVAVTLDMADDLVLLDETTIPDDQEQVEDRVHRASRMHQVTVHYLRVLDTQDEEIAWITSARYNVTHYILDGTRGVDFARQQYLAAKAS